MLVASLAFLLISVKTCPDGSVIRQDDRCPPVVDHRKQFALPPETTTKTVEWSCGRRSAKAQARVVEMPYTDERGEPVAKYLFKVELTELSLDGVPASPESQARVRAELAPLNSLIQLYGRCFADGVPELNMVGHSLTAQPRLRRTRIELK